MATKMDDRNGEERRMGDRRVQQLPFDGPDRRKGERRGALERRRRY